MILYVTYGSYQNIPLSLVWFKFSKQNDSVIVRDGSGCHKNLKIASRCYLKWKFDPDLPTSTNNMTMRFKSIIPVLLIILIIQGCATQQLINQGQTAYQQGNYDEALQSWEQVIQSAEDKGKQADAEVYFRAGQAAHKTGQNKKAVRYLEKADYLEYPSPKLYVTLAEASRSIDNLSKELDALEDYREKYPQGEKIDPMNVRLFETYVESENWQKAVDLWPEVKGRAASDLELLTGYLTVNEKLENDQAADQVARQILKMDPDNIPALEWMGKKYFWKAENLYVKEMTAYKNNRTTSQYKRLLNKLDEVYPTFEKARDYFLKLYRMDPQPEYAKFLGNIYKRLQEDQKASYYKRKAGSQ